MAQLNVSFSVEGDDEVISMFDTAGRRVGNLKTPMRAIGKMMLGYIDQNYGSHGGLWGRWKPRKRSYPWLLLEKSGRMRGGFKANATSNAVEIGNSQSYFKYHQSKKPRSSNLPRRVMMAVQDQQRRETMKILQQYVMEGK